MKITYYGHSCFGVQINGKNILFDPFISPNPLAKNIDCKTIKADYILLSHGHEDHVADAVDIAKRTGAKVVSAFEIHSWLNKQGVDNTHPMNVGGNWNFDFGNVKCVSAAHSSSLPDGTYGGEPMGFLIESSEGSFYYAGDTALSSDMMLLPNFHLVDFAFLPIGDNFTMGIEDAIVAADFIKTDKIIGMHYDTFDLIIIDKAKAIAAFKKTEKELILFEIGEEKNL